jgi:type 1 glutamine amidotransferase
VEDGFKVTVETDLQVLADPALNDFNLIVPIFTMSTIETDAAKNLANAVEQGVGLGGHHGGMSDAFRDSVNYQFIVGGQWVAHPGGIIDYSVDVTNTSDPIMHGVPTTFPYRSEQYYMHVDPAVEVLATTTFSGEHAAWTKGVVMPVVWKRLYGKGRVFHSTLGHNVTEFENPHMATVIRRGVNWAAKPE